MSRDPTVSGVLRFCYSGAMLEGRGADLSKARNSPDGTFAKFLTAMLDALKPLCYNVHHM
jgi:hypothetical protein